MGTCTLTGPHDDKARKKKKRLLRMKAHAFVGPLHRALELSQPVVLQWLGCTERRVRKQCMHDHTLNIKLTRPSRHRFTRGRVLRGLRGKAPSGAEAHHAVLRRRAGSESSERKVRPTVTCRTVGRGALQHLWTERFDLVKGFGRRIFGRRKADCRAICMLPLTYPQLGFQSPRAPMLPAPLIPQGYGTMLSQCSPW